MMINSSKKYSLEELQNDKLKLKKQIGEKKDRIQCLAQDILSPPKITTKLEAVMNGVESCMAVYDGIMFGRHAIRLFRDKFSGKKKS